MGVQAVGDGLQVLTPCPCISTSCCLLHRPSLFLVRLYQMGILCAPLGAPQTLLPPVQARPEAFEAFRLLLFCLHSVLHSFSILSPNQHTLARSAAWKSMKMFHTKIAMVMQLSTMMNRPKARYPEGGGTWE